MYAFLVVLMISARYTALRDFCSDMLQLGLKSRGSFVFPPSPGGNCVVIRGWEVGKEGKREKIIGERELVRLRRRQRIKH